MLNILMIIFCTIQANHWFKNKKVQAFLDFHSFNFRNFWFNMVYNSILFSSLLLPLSNLDFQGFCFPGFFMCPYNNSVNRGMPVLVNLMVRIFGWGHGRNLWSSAKYCIVEAVRIFPPSCTVRIILSYLVSFG